MLGAIRRATKSWWVKGFLILLAATFALFFGGGTSMFSDLANKPVAEVGGVEISQQDFADQYLRQLRQFRGITPDQARSIGLPENILGQLIGGALIDNAVKDLGVAVSNALLVEEIRRQFPELTSNLYELTVNQQGFTVAEFETLLREDIARALIVDTVTLAPPAPRVLAETIFRYRQEQRVAQALTIPAQFISEVGQPEGDALRDHYSANIMAYTAPEYRTVAFIALQPEDVFDTIVIAEPDIVEEYEIRLGEFTTIANRGISELRFSLEATALAAQVRMEGGAQFETADPRALRGDPFLRPAEPDPDAEPEPVDTGPVGVLDRGELTHDQLPTEVADAVFAMPQGTISQPLQSSDGWHIFRIDSVELGNVLTLEEARETVTDTLMRNAALEILYDLSIDLDDALAGGDSLGEAANRLGLIPLTATFDNQGLDHDGNPVGDIPAFVTFVSTAFQTLSGGESLLNEAVEGGYFVLRIDGVEAPGPIPFDEVRGEVARDWGLAEQTRLTDELATDLFERAKSGTDIAALGAEVGIDFSITSPVTRSGGASSLMSAQLIGALFSIEFGAVAQAPSVGGGTTIGRLVEIIPADPSANPEALAQLITEFSLDMSEDLLTQFQGALEAKFGVRVDTAAFEQATFKATTGAVPLAPTRNPIGGF